MAKVCEECGKKTMSGHNVSHSNRKTKRSFGANIQIKKGPDGKKQRICTRCIKKKLK